MEIHYHPCRGTYIEAINQKGRTWYLATRFLPDRVPLVTSGDDKVDTLWGRGYNFHAGPVRPDTCGFVGRVRA